MNPSMLTQEDLDTSRQFIETSARPVDVARFHHAFDGAPGEQVIEALSVFQNADGGFGHGLEPDLQTPASSVLCTSLVFQILRETDVKPPEELLTKTIAYLLARLNKDTCHWRIIPDAAEQSPHAPWWNQAEGGERFDVFSLNPTAEILGYIYEHESYVPEGILPAVTEQVLTYLAALENIEMHDLLCCLRLMKIESLPKGMHEKIIQKLTQLVIPTVESDASKWSGYCLRPLDVIDSPDSPFMAGLEDAVAANLDYEIESRNEVGAWLPPWSWGGAFAEDWPKAQQAWSGNITVSKLLMLKRFNRI